MAKLTKRSYAKLSDDRPTTVNGKRRTQRSFARATCWTADGVRVVSALQLKENSSLAGTTNRANSDGVNTTRHEMPELRPSLVMESRDR